MTRSQAGAQSRSMQNNGSGKTSSLVWKKRWAWIIAGTTVIFFIAGPNTVLGLFLLVLTLGIILSALLIVFSALYIAFSTKQYLPAEGEANQSHVNPEPNMNPEALRAEQKGLLYLCYRIIGFYRKLSRSLMKRLQA